MQAIHAVAAMAVATSLLSADANVCPASIHPKFFQGLPIPTRRRAPSGKLSTIVAQTTQDVGLRFCDNGVVQTDPSLYPIETTVWGYGLKNGAVPPSWPGFTVIADSGAPIDITEHNGFDGLPHLLRENIDETIHVVHPGNGCDPPNLGNPGCVFLTTHLHGGNTPAIFDGYPERVFGPGDAFDYHYPNSQEAATLWRHDHVLGVTRLDVYAGLAQFYLLRDKNELERMRTAGAGCAVNQIRRPMGNNYKGSGDFTTGCEVEIGIQDRDFTSGGELFYQVGSMSMPEFFGPYMAVNGKVWPFLDVQPTFYRVRMLNGCDSRFLALQLVVSRAGEPDRLAPIYLIGTDDGFANAVSVYPAGFTTGGANPPPGRAVIDDYLLMGPGTRNDLFLSFAEFADCPDCVFTLTNSAGFPFSIVTPFVPAPDPTADGIVMQFRFTAKSGMGKVHPLPEVIHEGSTFFRAEIGPYVQPPPDRVRQVILSEETQPDGSVVVFLGAFVDGVPVPVIHWCSEKFQITEAPLLGSTEEWWIYNTTPDTHPIHIHEVSFEITGRCPMIFLPDGTPDFAATTAGIEAGTGCEGPRAGENGPKDIVHVYDGTVTQLRMTFDRPGLYVWHCHILSHEDNEMMRPLCVQTAPGTLGEDCAEFWSFCRNEFPDFPNPPVKTAGNRALRVSAGSVGADV